MVLQCATQRETWQTQKPRGLIYKILEKARPQGGEPILKCQVHGGGAGGRPQKGTGGLLGGTAGVLSVDPSWRHKPACLSKQLYAKKKKKHNFMLKTVRLLYVNDTWRVGNKPEGRAGTLCPCKEISKKHCPATSSPLRPGCKAVQGGRENTRTRVCFCRSGSRAGTRPRGAGP